PGAGVLLLLRGGHGLRQRPLGFLQVLGALIGELGGERALERLHAAVHQLVARLDVARRGEPDLLPQPGGGRRRGGEQVQRDSQGLLDGHAHSLDLATRASASRWATRATSRAGRPNARAAATTSSYSGFTRTPSAS